MQVINHLLHPFTAHNPTTQTRMSIQNKRLQILWLSALTGSLALGVSTGAASFALLTTFYGVAARFKWEKQSAVKHHPIYASLENSQKPAELAGLTQFMNFWKAVLEGETYFDLEEIVKGALFKKEPLLFFEQAIDQMVQTEALPWTQGEELKQGFQRIAGSSLWAFLGRFGSVSNPFVRLAHQTKSHCSKGFPLAGKTTYLNAETTLKMKRGTHLFVPQPLDPALKKNYSTKVRVYNGDTFQVARDLQKRGLHPVGLNMANESTAGGGFERGCRAQEEDLFCRSNYFQSLYRWENLTLFCQSLLGYQIPERGVIYSPSVQVFRETQKEGYAYCTPYAVDMIAAAAYNLGRKRNGPKDQKAYEAGMKDKMRAILRAAALKGNDSVVLGALGCGAFRNKPTIVSQFFKDVLKEKEFKGQFREIAFAVIDDHNGTNYNIFKRALHWMWI